MLSIEDRPFSFNSIVGQKIIVKELQERSKTMDFPNVMLFQGGTGTGKTTMARLVGALLCDPNPYTDSVTGVKNPNPESLVCQSVIQETYSSSVRFIDCSVLGKDGVKELKTFLNTRSMTGKHRSIILDEFQELNTHSRASILTLLEKPYKNTTLILTTMCPEKIDTALKSRAVVYDFKPPTEDDLAEHLFNLTEKSGIECPTSFYEEGLFTIAQSSQGSIRLALQYLERCLASGLFTEKDIANELGLISHSRLDSIVTRLFVKKEYKAILEFREFDFSEVFYKSRKALLNAYLYQLTGHATHKWQKKLYEALKGAPIEAILEAYGKAEDRGYLREDMFQFEVLRALRAPAQAPVRSAAPAPEARPVARRQAV